MFLSSLWLLLCAPNLLWVELGRKEQTKFRDSTAENGASRPRIHGQNPQSITFDGKKKDVMFTYLSSESIPLS